MKKGYSILFAVFQVLLTVRESRAASYTYSDTIDLGNVTNQNSWHWTLNAPAFSFVTGDSLSGTITFANGQRLQFNNMGGGTYDIWTRLFSPVLMNGTIQRITTLIDLQGAINTTNPQQSGLGMGFALIFSEFVSQAPDTFSFSGFSYMTTMDSISGTFESQPGGYLSAAVASGNGSISVVPEPSSSVLLCPGVLGFFLRRSRHQTTHYAR